MNYPVAPIPRELSWREVLTALTVSVGYLVVSFLLIGFKTDQLILATIFCTFYLASAATRKFILGFSVFIVFWVIFDYMKAFPNYLFNDVHIRDLYDTEVSIFGVQQGNARLTPNEYFQQHSFVMADVLSGLFYLCWMPVPLGFGVFLFFKDRKQFLRFSLSFLIVNLVGFVVYYLYPAAPPWYVSEHGFELIQATPGNTAGLARFDSFFGVTIFQSLYAKSSNVFAAMPSLHSAYPMVVVYAAWKKRMRAATAVFAVITAGIWFAAVYTNHHYVLDVLAGIVTAIAGIALFELLLLKNQKFRNFFSRYVALIS